MLHYGYTMISSRTWPYLVHSMLWHLSIIGNHYPCLLDGIEAHGKGSLDKVERSHDVKTDEAMFSADMQLTAVGVKIWGSGPQVWGQARRASITGTAVYCFSHPYTWTRSVVFGSEPWLFRLDYSLTFLLSEYTLSIAWYALKTSFIALRPVYNVGGPCGRLDVGKRGQTSWSELTTDFNLNPKF